MNQQSRSRSSFRLDMLVMLALALLAVVARLIPGPRIIDDAFITFRYARNIVQGLGFVYNPGEHVMGTTTPLYTLLLTVLGWLTASTQYPVLAPVFNALFDALNVVLLYRIAFRLLGHRLPGAALGLLWAVAPRSVDAAIGGMETSLYVMFMLGAWAAWLWRHTRLSAALTALATLTRPDALVWAGPLALAMIWDTHSKKDDAHTGAEMARPPVSVRAPADEQTVIPSFTTSAGSFRAIRRLPWAELAIFITILAPWVIFATLYFGNPIPHSIFAKLVTYNKPWYAALLLFAANYSIPFFEQITLGVSASFICAVIYPMLALLGTWVLIRRSWRAIPIVSFLWLYTAAFAISNAPMFQWYFVPPMTVYVLCLLAATWSLVGRPLGERGARIGVTVITFIWLGLSLNAWTLHPGYAQDRPMPRMVWNGIELIYRQVGERMARSAAPGAVLAADDIGSIGWYSDMSILDIGALISPQADRYYPVDPSLVGSFGFVIPPDLILDLKPNYIVIMEDYGKTALLKDSRFLRSYRLLDKRLVDAEHGYLLIFQRE